MRLSSARIIVTPVNGAGPVIHFGFAAIVLRGTLP